MQLADPGGSARIPVLMLSYYYVPGTYSGAIRSHRFVRHLEKLGFDITVFCAGSDRRTVVDGNVYRMYGELYDKPRQELRSLLEARLSVLVTAEWGTGWTLRAIHEAGPLVRARRPVVFSTFPPLATHWVGWWLKKRYGVRWVADFRDPFVGDPSRVARRSRYLDPPTERAIFREADAVIANTEPAAGIWRRRYPEFRHKMHVIWNGFDPAEPISPAPLPQRPYKVLLHTGAIYSTRHPGPLLSSLDRLIGRGDLNPATLQVQFVGPFERESLPDASVLDRLVAAGCVRVQSTVPRTEAHRFMASSDLLLLIDLLGDGPAVHVAAKLFEYVRIGRPILAIAKRGSTVEQVLEWSGIPYVMLYGDDSEAEADRKLLSFLSLPAEPTPFSRRFEEMFSAVPQALNLADLLDPAGAASRRERTAAAANC